MRFPSIIKDLLPSDSVKQLMDLVNQPNLVSGLKDAAQQLGWKEAWGTTQIQHAMMQTKKWMETFNSRWASENHETLRLGVNATGQLFFIAVVECAIVIASDFYVCRYRWRI